MAVKIGHSSKDENGKFAGGKAGDSTRKEVCTRKWYSGGWNVVLRPKTAALAEASAKACEAGCANNNIGYDQKQRNTLNSRAKAVKYDLSKITTPCECDCSAFMHVCAIAGGANLAYGSNGYTTRTMAAAFIKSGDYEKLTEEKYLVSDKYLKRGDILVKEGSHTVMILEDGAYADTKTESKKETDTTKPVKPASSDPTVKQWQIAAIADGFTFPKYGADGAWGAECVSVARKAVVKKRITYKYKNLTRLVQKAVGVKSDGLCGKDTDAAIRSYQKKHGLTVDGQCGLNTWKKILNID